MKEILLSGRKIEKIFRQGEKEIRVLDDVCGCREDKEDRPDRADF